MIMLNQTDLTAIVKVIVQQQKGIIGPLAVVQANKVTGLKVDDTGGIKVEVTESDSAKLLNALINRYEELFGKASIEVCRDAVKEIKPVIPTKELPPILQ